MKNGKTRKHSSFGPRVWNIHANNHDNRSRRLVDFDSQTDTGEKPNARPEFNSKSADLFFLLCEIV